MTISEKWERSWYVNRAVLLDVARWAAEMGEIVSALDAIEFFEKPYRYDHWHREWLRSTGSN